MYATIFREMYYLAIFPVLGAEIISALRGSISILPLGPPPHHHHTICKAHCFHSFSNPLLEGLERWHSG